MAGDDYDFIVVGAGSAGCAIANRLSEDGKHRVLLIEAGGRDTSINFRVPLMVVNVLKDPNVTWPLVTEPQAALNNRTQLWTRGRVLGGFQFHQRQCLCARRPGGIRFLERHGPAGLGLERHAALFQAHGTLS